MRLSKAFTFTYVAVLALAMSLFASCSSGTSSTKKTLAVSFAPQAYLLKSLAGDRFDVKTILPQGSDPETYDPGVGDLMALQDSRCYFTLSTPGFEEKTLERVRANFPDVDVSDVSVGIERITGTHRSTHGGAHGDEGDPHLWGSVRNARLMADAMTGKLCEIDPEGTALYRHRNDSLQRVLSALDSRLDSIVRASGSKAFVMPHPSLSYFARDYGLRQVALETEGKEASPAQYAERVAEAISSGASVLFYEKGHNPGQAQSVAEAVGIPAVAVSLNTEQWPAEMLHIAESL